MTAAIRFRTFAAGSAVAALSLAIAAGSAAGAPVSPPACAAGSPASQQQIMNAYRAAGTFRARQTNRTPDLPRAVTVSVPRIAFTGPGTSSNLPVGPCQTIYRFAFPRVRTTGGAVASPFRYA